MSGQPGSPAGVFVSCDSVPDVEDDLERRLLETGSSRVALITSATYRVHEIEMGEDKCTARCAYRILTYARTHRERPDGAPWQCDAGRTAAAFADEWIAFIADLPEEPEEANSPIPPSPESDAVTRLHRVARWPAGDCSWSLIEELYTREAIECALQAFTDFPRLNASNLPRFAAQIVRELTLCRHSNTQAWPVTNELTQALTSTFAAAACFERSLSAPKTPRLLLPIRTHIKKLSSYLNWQQVVCFDTTLHGLMSRRLVELQANQIGFVFEQRSYSPNEHRSMADRITELMRDPHLTDELLYPGHLSSWAIKLGRLEIPPQHNAQLGMDDLLSEIKQTENDVTDCAIGLYSEAMTLSHFASEAMTLRANDPSLPLIVKWATECQAEVERRSSENVSQLLRNIGLLRYIAECRSMPPETATLIQCGLSGQTPSNTVAEKACQALVRQGKADLAAAILRDILGYHENAYARISGIAQTRNVTLYLSSASSFEEAYELASETGYQRKLDPLTDEVLDFVIDYIVDRNC